MAGRRTWITAQVECLLQDEWGVCRVRRDADGDYPFRAGTAAAWVGVIDTEPVMVRVFAHAAYGLKPTAALLRELNEIQLRALSASVALSGGTVIVSQTLSPHGLTRKTLRQALRAVGGVADDIGLLLAGMYGGSTPFPATDSVDSEA